MCLFYACDDEENVIISGTVNRIMVFVINSFEYFIICIIIIIYFIAFSAQAFIFAGCSTVIILSIAHVMFKKKAPADPLFYGMDSEMHVFMLGPNHIHMKYPKVSIVVLSPN